MARSKKNLTRLFLALFPPRRANLDGTNVETVISKHLATADGIAVDWIAKVSFLVAFAIFR